MDWHKNGKEERKMNKKELCEKMQNARSWAELGLSIKEVYDCISVCECSKDEVGEANSKEIKELREKYEELVDINRQLKAENKKLRNGTK